MAFTPTTPAGTPRDQVVEVSSSEQLAAALVGRRIVGASRAPDSGEDWGLSENGVTLTLDDGTTVEFGGWGYDSSGLDTYLTPPPLPEP